LRFLDKAFNELRLLELLMKNELRFFKDRWISQKNRFAQNFVKHNLTATS